MFRLVATNRNFGNIQVCNLFVIIVIIVNTDFIRLLKYIHNNGSVAYLYNCLSNF